MNVSTESPKSWKVEARYHKWLQVRMPKGFKRPLSGRKLCLRECESIGQLRDQIEEYQSLKEKIRLHGIVRS